MPVRERKFYIEKHNAASKEENAKMEGKSNGNHTEANINAYANVEQSNLKNMNYKR